MADTWEIPSREPDRPERPRLEDVINAEFALERWQTRGRLAQHIILMASVGMALHMLTRTGAWSLGAKLVLSLWLTAMILFVVSVVAGKRALDRVDRLVAASSGRRIRHDDPGPPS